VVGTETIFVFDGLAEDEVGLPTYCRVPEQRASGKVRQGAFYPVGFFLASLSRFHPEQLLLTQSEVAVFASSFLLQNRRK
jgi:hypothetical protein